MPGFGLVLPHHGAAWPDVLASARRAEECGFASVWLDDHFIPPVRPDDLGAPYLETWSVLAGLAAATERIRFGALVTGVAYRSPALLAKMAATVDVMSGGRLEFGIGAGWYEREYRSYGYVYPPIRVRQEQLEEALQIVRAMWLLPEATLEGKHFRVEGALCSPKPAQQPHPPIWLGGGGERRAFALAARYADWSNFGGPVAEVARKVPILRQRCEEAGRDPATLGVSLLVRVRVAEGAKAAQFRETAAQAGGVGGTPEECAEQLAAYARAGIEYFCCLDAHRPESTELLGRKVAPLVNQMAAA